MKLKDVEEELIQLNTLANQCGFFTSDTDENNGYGCTCPKEISGFKKEEVGTCHGYDCPMGHEADLDDLKKLDAGLYEEYKGEEYGPSETGSGWMVKDSERITA